ncbi:hypothetical protein [Endozoicomonas sp. 8E]|uniref:hypothetical protein n=1 Tax=Endozoicomonas sp. 8E TaxID=3035692 RepID=UPI002939254A|nr:hypothetical protein [Endozoicomonas sp. 8E]WOG29889.1 hypothetical protein P6910_09600 [Endozoicomonas sp. 8E]
MSNRENPIVVELCNELEEKLKKSGVLQKVFFTHCFYYPHNKENEESLKSYLNRNKLSKLSKQKDPDKISLFLYFFDNHFDKKSNKHEEDEKNAAFDFYVELSSRVTTIELDPNLGCNLSALKSIYSLFQRLRDICHSYGKSCIQFQKSSNQFLTKHIRPFTTKWHPQIESDNYDHTAFRKELNELQARSTEYMETLENMIWQK